MKIRTAGLALLLRVAALSGAASIGFAATVPACEYPNLSLEAIDSRPLELDLVSYGSSSTGRPLAVTVSGGNGYVTPLGDGTAHVFPPSSGAPVSFMVEASETGGSGTCSGTVTVTFLSGPEADFSSTCSGLTCSFTDQSTASFPIVTRDWAFGDGASASGTSVSHTYDGPGSYPARLAVQDNHGLIGRAARSVGVGGFPSAPSDLMFDVLDQAQIILSWTDNADQESGYRIDIRKANGDWGEDYLPIQLPPVPGVGGSASRQVFTGPPQPDDILVFRVVALSALGEASAKLATDSVKPAGAGDVDVTVTSSSTIHVEWTDGSANEETFLVQVRPAGTSQTPVTIAQVGINVEEADATLGTGSWELVVRARNASGLSNILLFKSFEINGTEPNDPPVAIDDNALQPPPGEPFPWPALTFEVPAAAPYVICNETLLLNDSDPNGDPLRLQGPLDTNGLDVEIFGAALPLPDCQSQAPGQFHVRITPACGPDARLKTFRYRAADEPHGAISNWATVSVLVVPVAPKLAVGVQATRSTADPYAARIEWDLDTEGSEPESIEIWRLDLTAGGSSTLVATLPPTARQYDDTSLAPDSTYEYRVRSVNCAAGFASFATTMTTAPAAPTDLTAAVAPVGGASFTVRLTWTDNASTETGYEVTRCLGPDCFSVGGDGGGSQQVFPLPADTTTWDDATAQLGQTYSYRVAALDALGSSPPSNAVPITAIPAEGELFTSSFGDPALTDWTYAELATVTDLVSFEGPTSLAVTLPGSNQEVFVADATPDDASVYSARFLFHPGDLTMQPGDVHNLFAAYPAAAPTAAAFRLEVRETAGVPEVQLVAHTNSSGPAGAGWVPLERGRFQTLEIFWLRAQQGQTNGAARLWLDGAMVGEITDLDNDEYEVDRVALGAVWTVDAGSSGTCYFDAFESHLGSAVGPIDDPILQASGFDDPSFSDWDHHSLAQISADRSYTGPTSLAIPMGGAVPIYVEDRSPAGESSYRMRFFLHPGTLAMAADGIHAIAKGYPTDLTAFNDTFTLLVQQVAGETQLRVYLKRDDGAAPSTPWVALPPDRWTEIEVDWQQALPGLSNGHVELYFGGELVAARRNVDNDQVDLDFVQVGAMHGPDASSSGTYYIDAYEARRLGPVTALESSIFADGGESGVGTWSAAGPGIEQSGKFTVQGRHSLAVPTDSGVTFLTDDSPSAETDYVARFYLTPDSAAYPAGWTVFEAWQSSFVGSVFTLELEDGGGSGKPLKLNAIASGSSSTVSVPLIAESPNLIEVRWKAAASGRSDGRLELAVNGAEAGTVDGLANDFHRIEEIRLGAVQGAPVSGTLFVDAFESRRYGAIGPLADEIFADDFADGVGRWDTTFLTPGGSLGMSGGRLAADLDGSVGGSKAYVIDQSPVGEGVYRVRLSLDPTAFTFSSGLVNVLMLRDALEGLPVAKISLRATGSGYALQAKAWRNDGVTQAWSPEIPITGPVGADLEWWRASTRTNANGGFQLTVTEGSTTTVEDNVAVDNGRFRIDRLDLGVVSGAQPGTQGAVTFDDVETWRSRAQ